MSVPRACNASKCVSSRRLPMRSPPGRLITTWPRRASSGPASNVAVRICRLSSSSGSWSLTPKAVKAHCPTCSSCTTTPIFDNNANLVRTSPISGTLCKCRVSSVSRHAASSGNAAFLLPMGVIDPVSRCPPSTQKYSMITLPAVCATHAKID